MPRRCPPNRPAAAQPRIARQIARAIAHVETHLDAPLDATTLAAVAAMSRHHFHRMFLAQVGCSVAGYVTWRRLQRACAMLVSGREPVLEVALAVGYESAQALAKAMRRELDLSPTEVRRGLAPVWTSLFIGGRRPGRSASPESSEPCPALPLEIAMNPDRFARLDAAVPVLTATARGMVDGHLSRAAQQAFGELMQAIGQAGLMPQIRSCVALCPDDPQGPDDPHCRYQAGVVFGHDLARGDGPASQPPVTLTGTLAWERIGPGRHAVFTHRGPYSGLGRTWSAIYGDWAPRAEVALRDAVPFEVCLNTPDQVAPEDLLTEIWIPVAD